VRSIMRKRQGADALHGVVVDTCSADDLIAREAGEIGDDDLALHTSISVSPNPVIPPQSSSLHAHFCES